jgi:hypothetical protein
MSIITGMRSIVPSHLAIALLIGACGGPPLLANAPRLNTSAVAGGAAAAAAAITLASPGYGAAKPEKAPPTPMEVHEQVTPDVLDRLDHNDQAGVANGSTEDSSAAPPPSKPSKAQKRKGPLPHIPLPSEAIRPTDDTP